MPRRLSSLVPALVFALGPTSCLDGHQSEPGGTAGTHNELRFIYCDAPGECDDGDRIADPIAVGAKFDLVPAGDWSEGELTLESGDSLMLERFMPSVGDSGFIARNPGTATVKARLTSTNELLDEIDVHLAPPDALAVRQCARAENVLDGPGYSFYGRACGRDFDVISDVSLSRGSSLAPSFCAFSTGDDGRPLGGLLPFKWRVFPESTAELEMYVSRDGRCATIGGLIVGSATVEIAAVGLMTRLGVTVGP